jgi:heme ABC exporter ATP-binding subunit CcmA
MTHSSPPLQATELTKHYGSRTILRRIGLEIAAGEAVALRGGNGAGKTTLLRCLASITRPTRGEVCWFGRSAYGNPALRRWVGMVAHESHLYPHLTLRENLVFAGRMYGIDRAAERADQLLVEVGLAEHAQRLPMQVSRGMGQRVAVARALVHQPPILLLDEPFSGLDAEGRAWLTHALVTLRETGCAICFSTHDEALAEQLADRVWELRCGRLYELSTARQWDARRVRERELAPAA